MWSPWTIVKFSIAILQNEIKSIVQGKNLFAYGVTSLLITLFAFFWTIKILTQGKNYSATLFAMFGIHLM